MTYCDVQLFDKLAEVVHLNRHMNRMNCTHCNHYYYYSHYCNHRLNSCRIRYCMDCIGNFAVALCIRRSSSDDSVGKLWSNRRDRHRIPQIQSPNCMSNNVSRTLQYKNRMINLLISLNESVEKILVKI